MLTGEDLKVRQDIDSLEQEQLKMKRANAFPSTMLSDTNSYINKNKYEGMQVWNSTTKKPAWATGAAPSDPWISV